MPKLVLPFSLFLALVLLLASAPVKAQTELITPPTHDTYMQENFGNCQPTSVTMLIQQTDVTHSNGAVQFDPVIPDGAVVTSASVRFYNVTGTANISISIYGRGEFDPAEEDDCASIDTTPLTSPVVWNIANVTGYVTTPDLAGLINELRGDGIDTVALVLRPTGDSSSTRFLAATEYGTAYYPRLTLEYAMPTAVPTPSPTPSPTPIIFATSVYSLPGGVFSDTYAVTAPGEPFDINSLPDPVMPLDVTEIFSFQSLNYMISTARAVPRLITRLPGYRYLVWLVVFIVAISVFMRMRAAAKTALGQPRVNPEGKEL